MKLPQVKQRLAGPVANGKGAALAYNADGSVCKTNNNR